MPRYTGPSWKISHRLGISSLGTGKELARRPYASGQYRPNSRGKQSEYDIQLAEKQKLCHMYGMNERRFHNLLARASKIKEDKHSVNFMILLERRLDNVVYRLGLVTTRRQARQLANHGHTLVDGRCVDIPSHHVGVGQATSAREKSQNIVTVKETAEVTIGRPTFVSFDVEKLEGSLVRLPECDELYPEVDEAPVVEYYDQSL